MPPRKAPEKPGLADLRGSRTIFIVRACWIIIFLFLVPSLSAHQISEISVDVEVADSTWTARVELDAAYMLPELRGDQDIAPLDMAWLRTREPEEWQRIQREARTYLEESLILEGTTPSIAFPDFERSPPVFMNRGAPEMPPIITAELRGTLPASGLKLRWQEAFGVVLIVSLSDGAHALVSGETLEVASGEPTPGFFSWVRLGFRHILPAGLDHILFILGIFLMKANWRPLLWQSLVFTLTHSVTLGLAVAGWLTIPGSIVEPIIALSIIWIAVENLRGMEVNARRYLVVGAFGLIHGLGFALMLENAIASKAQLITSLIGFNLGVEVGQITILALAFALSGWWREKAFRKLRIGGSVAIAAIAAFWFLERTAASIGLHQADRTVFNHQLAISTGGEDRIMGDHRKGGSTFSSQPK